MPCLDPFACRPGNPQQPHWCWSGIGTPEYLPSPLQCPSTTPNSNRRSHGLSQCRTRTHGFSFCFLLCLLSDGKLMVMIVIDRSSNGNKRLRPYTCTISAAPGCVGEAPCFPASSGAGVFDICAVYRVAGGNIDPSTIFFQADLVASIQRDRTVRSVGREGCSVCPLAASPRTATAAASVARWSAMMSLAAARAFVASLLSLPLLGTASVDGHAPDLSDILADDLWAAPRLHNRLPACMPACLPACLPANACQCLPMPACLPACLPMPEHLPSGCSRIALVFGPARTTGLHAGARGRFLGPTRAAERGSLGGASDARQHPRTTPQLCPQLAGHVPTAAADARLGVQRWSGSGALPRLRR